MTETNVYIDALKRMQIGCSRVSSHNGSGRGSFIQACADVADEMVREVHAGYAMLAGDGHTDAIGAVIAERARQEVLWPGTTCAGQLSHGAKLAILLEEVGEVAHELTEAMNATGFMEEADIDKLRTELVQVAAVAVAWVESLTTIEVSA